MVEGTGAGAGATGGPPPPLPSGFTEDRGMALFDDLAFARLADWISVRRPSRGSWLGWDIGRVLEGKDL